MKNPKNSDVATNPVTAVSEDERELKECQDPNTRRV